MTDNLNRNYKRARPLGVAVIGMGGFAGAHHETLYDLERMGCCRVVATCDPDPGKYEALAEYCRFHQRAIPVYIDYREMLQRHRHEIDFVTVPTPIPMHASMHQACVELGLACYLEKPPTLFWREMEEMLLVEEQAASQTLAGFAHIVEEPRQRLKKRLVRGEFGPLHRVGFTGQWPRDSAYFQRTPWAGRLELDGQLILDSCIGNAMSHYIHNLLFWCGQDDVMSWGEVEEVEAELYRAHSIENFDTCFARGSCSNGVGISIAATHTGIGASSQHVEWLECEKADVTYTTGATIRYDIAWRDGRRESEILEPEPPLKANILAYISYLQGESTRPPTRLIDSRPFVYLNNLLYVAAGTIHTIAEEHVHSVRNSRNEASWVLVEGMQEVIEQFRCSGLLPGEGRVPWGLPGGCALASRVSCIVETVRRMQVVVNPDCLQKSGRT